MLLSGLNAIDFSGLMGGLSGDIGGQQAADIVWSHLPWLVTVSETAFQAASGMSADDFKSKIAGALSGQYKLTKSDSQPSNTASDQSIINLSPKNADIISGALQKMRDDGYYIVSAQSTPVQTPAQSDSIAYRGTIAAQQAGSPSSQPQTQPATVSTASPAVQIQQRQSRPTIYKRVPYKQTAAEKQRLIWIIAGFGIAFALAIGAIASSE